MKRFNLLLLALLFASVAVQAQDVIVLRNAEELKAKVKSVTQTDVSYVKWENLNGPSYTINKSDIFYIKYENGTKDVFTEVAQPLATTDKKSAIDQFNRVRFQSYIYIGADFTSGLGGPSLDFSLGARIKKYGYIGLGFGMHNLLAGGGQWTPYIPITVDAKVYLPVAKDLYPHIDVRLGAWVDIVPTAGFYMHTGLGIDYKRFSFAVGYQMMTLSGSGFWLNMGYVNVGVRLGKK